MSENLIQTISRSKGAAHPESHIPVVDGIKVPDELEG